MSLKLLTVIAGSLIMLSSLVACKDVNSSRDVSQDGICSYSNEETAKKCQDGKLAWFKPNSWGNEQLPLLVAATYCDTNHQVILNNSGVICVFTSKRVGNKGAN